MSKLTCFKAYDIRGCLGEELNVDIVYRIGRAFLLFFKSQDFCGRVQQDVDFVQELSRQLVCHFDRPVALAFVGVRRTWVGSLWIVLNGIWA